MSTLRWHKADAHTGRPTYQVSATGGYFHWTIKSSPANAVPRVYTLTCYDSSSERRVSKQYPRLSEAKQEANRQHAEMLAHHRSPAGQRGTRWVPNPPDRRLGARSGGTARAAKQNPAARAPTYRLQPFHAATWFITSRAGIKMAAEDVEWCRLSGYPTQGAEKSLHTYVADARRAGATHSEIETWKLAGAQAARQKFKAQNRAANPAKGPRKGKTQRRALRRQK